MLTVTCHLCKAKGKLVPPKNTQPVSFTYPSWTTPIPWVRGMTAGRDVGDFCCPAHRDFCLDALAIGPPAIRLLFKIFNRRDGDE